MFWYIFLLPEDERNVIYGVIKDSCNDPVADAVVKLIEICYEKGEEVRKPVSHTFTDEYGEFVFGPLCPDRKYAVDIWVNRTTHLSLYFIFFLFYIVFSVFINIIHFRPL